VAYSRDFALNFAQKFGNPVIDIAYQPGISQEEIDALELSAKQLRNSGWIVRPNNGAITFAPEHRMGGDNAQMALMRFADQQCQLLMLGQTLTTDVADSGSRALGDVHENVRQEKIEELARWMAQILTEQFAESLLVENYGKDYLRNPERPTVLPDLSRPLSVAEKGLLLIQLTTSRVPLPADKVYELLAIEQPEPGDEVLVQGQPQLLEESLTPTDKKQKDFETQLDQQMQVNELMQPETGTAPPPGGGQESSVQSHRIPVNSPSAILAALAVATEQERTELESLVSAAEKAPHTNGEVPIIQAKVTKLLNKRRFSL
jgi:phage gp29-like protein